MVIRSCRARDVDAIRGFVNRCKPLDLHSAFTYWVLCTCFPDTCLLMEGDEGIIGFASGVPSSAEQGVFYFWQIGVAPECRGRGHATALIEKMVEAALHGGCHALQVTIAPENTASLRVFSRFAERRGRGMKKKGRVDFTDSLSSRRVVEDLYEIELLNRDTTLPA
ncbi:MAG: GNAT family N-acetyltransferase [Deltaproteobacteria bacterium]|nr:GNAT family N-acetyltransferase [Deltaproteobacteria bacterium]